MIRRADSNHQYNPVRTAAKVAAATAVATGAAAGTVLILAKKGKLNAVADGNKHIEGVKAFLKKYADPANDFIGEKAGKIRNNANEFISKHEKLANLKTSAGEVISNIKEFDLVKHIAVVRETVGDFFRSIPTKAGNLFDNAKENLGKIFHRAAKK